MKNIALPTDFSKNSENAIDYALNLFKDEACRFYLLHTYTPIIYSYDFNMSAGNYADDVSEMVKKNAEERLKSQLKKLNKKHKNDKHSFELVTSFNTLTDELKSFTKKHDIELIVMGTKGASGAQEVLFGTNTIHVINKVKCPVMAIPNEYKFEPPVDILFPTDYKIDYDDKHLNIIKAIALNFKSKIHIVHVTSDELNYEQSKNSVTLERLLLEYDDVYETVRDDYIPEAINSYQNQNQTQLLAMINNKHSFFENLFFKPVISRISLHLKTPFLVIPS
ncbi:MAG: universal stress protein [Flavobacteriaceae bacterium]|nr:universal stress protein [Flavobacteriaceae bacterium]